MATESQLLSELESLHKAIVVINHLAAELDIDVAMNSVRKVALELLDCDKVTLFLVFERRRELRGQACETEGECGLIIRINFGEGIAGTVAATGEVMNISDAYSHNLFNPAIDKMTGYRTRTILCCPIDDMSGHRVAVLQALNKNNGQAFTSTDEKHLKLFGVHLGNSLSKARLHEEAKREKDRLASIYVFFKALSSACDLSSLLDLTSEALQNVLQAEYVFVFLSDSPRGELWAQWQVDGTDSVLFVRLKVGQGIVGTAAETRVCMSLADNLPLHDPVFRSLAPVLEGGAASVKSVLVQPVVDKGKCLAVILAVNKAVHSSNTDMFHEDTFTESDCDAMKLFALEVGDTLAHHSLELAFSSALSVVGHSGVRAMRPCSSSGHSADLLRTQLMNMYFQQPAEHKRDSLNSQISCPPGISVKRSSYPTTPVLKALVGRAPYSESEGERVLLKEKRRRSGPAIVPNPGSHGAFFAFEALRDWDLDFTHACEGELVKMAYDMLLMSGVVDHFGLSTKRLRCFLSAVSSHYREVPYHNFSHVVYVMHTVWMMLVTTPLKGLLSMADQLALLLAALCHDLDHDGHSNSWHVNTCSQLARIYNDVSVMENHHCAMTFAILSKKECALFDKLDQALVRDIRKSMIAAILSTDMVNHYTLTQTFKQHSRHFNAETESDRMLLMKVLLHAADIGNAVRPFGINQVFSSRLHLEFQAQAAEETALSLPITFNVDAADAAMCARVELNFLDYVAAPLWEALVDALPSLECCMVRMKENRTQFSSLLKDLDDDSSGVPSSRSSTGSLLALPEDGKGPEAEASKEIEANKE